MLSFTAFREPSTHLFILMCYKMSIHPQGNLALTGQKTQKFKGPKFYVH